MTDRFQRGDISEVYWSEADAADNEATNTTSDNHLTIAGGGVTGAPWNRMKGEVPIGAGNIAATNRQTDNYEVTSFDLQADYISSRHKRLIGARGDKFWIYFYEQGRESGNPAEKCQFELKDLNWDFAVPGVIKFTAAFAPITKVTVYTVS